MNFRVEIDDHQDTGHIKVEYRGDDTVWIMSPHTAANIRVAIQQAQVRRLEEREWEWEWEHTS